MPNPVSCCHPSCNCSFQSQQAMLQHCQDRHDLNPRKPKIPCALCNRSFPTSIGLRDHLRAAHPLMIDAYFHLSAAAPNINQINLQDLYPNAAAAAAAAAAASPPDPLQLVHGVACNDCGRSFKTTDALHQHQWNSPGHTRVSQARNPNFASPARVCSQCAQRFPSADALEQHYVEQHPLTEIPKSDEQGTWQHIAERFRSAWKKPTIKLYDVHHIFKVYNPGWRRKEFEVFRKELKQEMANQKLVKEHNHELRNKVLHDGNELRRYHGTTVKCQLGRPPPPPAAGADESHSNISSGLCRQSDCNMCRIIQSGFKKSMCKVERFQRFGRAIYCSSISSKASGYVQCSNYNSSPQRSLLSNIFGTALSSTSNYKVMMACKVLAGRPFHSTSNLQQLQRPPTGFHSVQGDPGVHLHYEELVLYDDRAILPDLIILYSSSD